MSLCSTGVYGFSQIFFLETLGFGSEVAVAQPSPNVQLEQARWWLELGRQYFRMGQFREAERFWNLSLAMYREPILRKLFPQDSRDGESRALGNLGNVQLRLGEFRQAMDFYQQQLAITREIGDRAGEGRALGNMGNVYFSLGQFHRAIDLYEQRLEIARDIGDRAGASAALGNLGNSHRNLGQFQHAIDLYQQQLVIIREADSSSKERRRQRSNEGVALGNLGNVYRNLGQFQQSIDLYQQQLSITREIGDRYGEGTVLGNLGTVYRNLGQIQTAIDFYEQYLIITREIEDKPGEGRALGNLGNAYLQLGQIQQAIDFYQQALIITDSIGDRVGESAALGNLGNAYLRLGQFQQAITFYQKQLVIAREIGDQVSEGIALGNLGVSYQKLGYAQEAMDRYQQALAIYQSIGDRASEGVCLSNIGSLLALQDQPELAIVFYKQSVNVRELIRSDILGLPQDQQQLFIETIADDYRALADLLLQQDRILEAQRVLDLLKVQELDEYLQGVRSTAQTESGVALFDPETEIRNQAIVIGRRLAELRAIPVSELTDSQKQQLTELDTAQRAIISDFQGFIESPEIQALVTQLSTDAQEQDVLAELDEFINLQNNLREIGEHTVLIYPLILKDRLELVLITPFSEPTRYPVNVERTELNQAIVEFRQALHDPRWDVTAIAQKLYSWLIEPMVNDLEAIGTDTLLYAPDGALRYVPLAAFHNGEHWLVEQFRINHITAASLQDFTLSDTIQPQILAAGFSEGTHVVQEGDRTFDFSGLPFAGQEVKNLVATFPGTTALLNDDFNRADTEPIMDSHTIVHLATHAAFVQGSPNDSFILFGDGSHVTLEEIKGWRGRFNQVDLFVLSACETGLGGQAFNTPNLLEEDDIGNGEEILGFGYLMQEAGAEAAIASLWQVSDGGTQALMDAFYAALNNGYSKAEALQRAQQALITGNYEVLGLDERGATGIRQRIQNDVNPELTGILNHPYYWAPFILIGNGL